MSTNVRLALAFYGPMLAVSLAYIAWRDGPAFFRPLPWSDTLAAVALGLAVAFLTVLFSDHAARYQAWAQALKDELIDALGPLSMVDVMTMAAASGLAEETLFRGCLLPALGLWGSSILFALAHFPVRPALRPWTVFAFVMGLALGIVDQTTGSLWGPIVAHATINGINLSQMAAEQRENQVHGAE